MTLFRRSNDIESASVRRSTKSMGPEKHLAFWHLSMQGCGCEIVSEALEPLRWRTPKHSLVKGSSMRLAVAAQPETH